MGTPQKGKAADAACHVIGPLGRPRSASPRSFFVQTIQGTGAPSGLATKNDCDRTATQGEPAEGFCAAECKLPLATIMVIGGDNRQPLQLGPDGLGNVVREDGSLSSHMEPGGHRGGEGRSLRGRARALHADP